MKKILRILLGALLALTLLFVIGAWVKFGPLVKAATSVQKLDEGLYYMEYKGDDGHCVRIPAAGTRQQAGNSLDHGHESGQPVRYLLLPPSF